MINLLVLNRMVISLYITTVSNSTKNFKSYHSILQGRSEDYESSLKCKKRQNIMKI